MITCDVNNEGSRRTILSCGGIFERIVNNGNEKLERYWIIPDDENVKLEIPNLQHKVEYERVMNRWEAMEDKINPSLLGRLSRVF